MKELEKDLKTMQDEVVELKRETKNLNEKLITQEMYSRRNNVKIWEITTTNADLEATVIRILTEAGVSLTAREIEHVHYVGPRTSQKAVLMRFCNFKDKL